MNITFRLFVPGVDLVTNSSDMPINVILIPVDFSEVADTAIVHGLELGHRLQYRVCFLHVVTTRSDTTLNMEAEALQHSRRELVKIREKYEHRFDVQIDLLIRAGNLFKVFNSVIAEMNPALLVLGNHGKQGLQHLFGSYALKVVLDASCPVLVIPGRAFTAGYLRVALLITSVVDPNPLLEWVLLLFKLFKAEFHLIQQVDPNPDKNNLLKGISLQISRVLKENNIPYRIDTAESSGNFSSQAVSYATEHHADLMMAMTLPAAGATGFNFSDWNERLMFNPDRIPVMFIDQEDPKG
jgi:nucleotide-binding universal stress UspA family protein